MSTNTKRSIPESLGRALALALLASVVPACGGGGGGGGGGGAPAPFVVTFHKPDPSPSVTALRMEVYVRFGAVVDDTTVDQLTTFKVEAPGPVAVLGAFQFTTALKEVRFVPTNALSTSTTYTVTLTAGIKDMTARALTPFSFTFTTGAQTDSTRPTFAGATGAVTPTLSSIDLTWGAATDASAITYEVYRSLTSGVYDFASAPAYTTAATGISATALASNKTYYFVVRARDADGNSDLNTAEVSNKTITSFVNDVYPIVQSKCRSCHIPGQMAQEPPYNITTMDYTSAATTRTTWVGVAVSPYNNDGVGAPFPAGAKRVVASDSSKSFVYNKINSKFLSVLPWSGLGMPRTGGPLSAAQILTIKDWIDEGALNN